MAKNKINNISATNNECSNGVQRVRGWKYFWFLFRYFLINRYFCDAPWWAKRFYWWLHKFTWMFLTTSAISLIMTLLGVDVFK